MPGAWVRSYRSRMKEWVTGTRRASTTLWRHRDFLLLWSGQAVSQAGSQVTVLALPLVAIVILHATAFQVGLLSAAVTTPLRGIRDLPADGLQSA